MAKLYILKIYNKRKTVTHYSLLDRRENLEKDYRYFIYVAFSIIPILILRTVLHIAIPQKSFCTVICGC
jgi:hypothetical protein